MDSVTGFENFSLAINAMLSDIHSFLWLVFFKNGMPINL